MFVIYLHFVFYFQIIHVIRQFNFVQSKDTSCTSDRFLCKDGSNCLSNNYRCDGEFDCPDGSDECSVKYCRVRQCRKLNEKPVVQCLSGLCVLDESSCTNVTYCSDYSDDDCVARDKFGVIWTASPDTTPTKPCNGSWTDSRGLVKWKCLTTGFFEGHAPNADDCFSGWLNSIEHELAENFELRESDIVALLIRTEEKTTILANASSQPYFGNEIKKVLGIGGDIIKRLPNNTDIEKFANYTSQVFGIIGNVIRNNDSWNELTSVQYMETRAEVITAMENTGFELAIRASNENSSAKSFQKIFNDSVGFKLTAGVLSTNMNETLVQSHSGLPFVGSLIVLPENWKNQFPNDTTTVPFVEIEVKYELANTLFSASTSSNDTEHIGDKVLNGDVISFSLSSSSTSGQNSSIEFDSNAGVQITFYHHFEATSPHLEFRRIQRKDSCGNNEPKAILGSSVCVYWDTKDFHWSTTGCKLKESNKTISICECSHLTSFALLMDRHKHSSQDFGLELLTWIILPISCICLLISVIVLIISSVVPNDRSVIALNLCFCLLSGNIMLLVFVDRSYFCLDYMYCQISATLTHFVFLSAFSWMGFEAVLLYKRIFIVFASTRRYIRIQHIVAYGIPALIVGCTWTISIVTSQPAYANDEYCWLTEDYIWAFMGPVALGNTILLCFTWRLAYKLIHGSASHVHREQKDCLSWLKGSLSLTVLLGITWIFGFTMLVNNTQVGTVAAYTFTVFNASQGISLFVFAILLDKRVHTALAKRFPMFSILIRSSESSNRSMSAQLPVSTFPRR